MIKWSQDNKWRISIPEGTMYKRIGYNKPYAVDLMRNSFKAYLNYIQTGRFALFESLDAKDWETVRQIAIGRRDIPLKVNLE